MFVARGCWGGVQPGRSILGSGREQDLVPPEPQELEPPGRGFGVGAVAVLSVGGEESELFVD